MRHRNQTNKSNLFPSISIFGLGARAKLLLLAPEKCSPCKLEAQSRHRHRGPRAKSAQLAKLRECEEWRVLTSLSITETLANHEHPWVRVCGRGPMACVTTLVKVDLQYTYSMVWHQRPHSVYEVSTLACMIPVSSRGCCCMERTRIDWFFQGKSVPL